MPAPDLDLIHNCLGHACEAMYHTQEQHSQLYSNAQKAGLHSSHLSQPCHVCALGKVEVLTLVVYQVLVVEYLAVLIYLLTLMAACAVVAVVGLAALALLYLPVVVAAAKSS